MYEFENAKKIIQNAKNRAEKIISESEVLKNVQKSFRDKGRCCNT